MRDERKTGRSGHSRRERPGAGVSRERKARRHGHNARGSDLLRPARGALIVLLAVLAAGFGLRMAYLGELRGEPDYSHPLVDSHYHDYWARAAASGDWSPPRHEPDPQIQANPYFRPPGYPYFLTGVYKLFGDDYTTPRVVQHILGLAGILLIFMLGRRVFNTTTGLVAAGLHAFYWIFIYFEGEFLEPPLTVPLILVFAILLIAWSDRRAVWLAAAAGLALGALAITRPNGLVLAPVGIWWILHHSRGAAFRLRLLRDAGLFLLATVVVILPVTLRNHRVSGEFVPISTNSGINLLISIHERADGQVRGTLPGIGTLDTCFDWPDVVRRVRQIEDRSLSHNEVSGWMTSRAVKKVMDDPVRALGLLGRKTLLFWGPGEVADNKVMEFERANSRILRRIPLTFPVALALGLMGIAAVFADRRLRESTAPGPSAQQAATAGLCVDRTAVWLMIAIVAAWFASHLPFVITSRYRVPIIPFLLVFGAGFLVQLEHLLRAGRLRTAIVALCLAIALTALAHRNLVYEPSAARWHYQRGIAHVRGEDLDAAIGQMKLAIAENPRYTAVYNDLGVALGMTGEIAESVRYFEQSLALDPGRPLTHRNLAMALEYLGELERSRHHYSEALRLNPADRLARDGLNRTAPAREGS